MLIFWVLNFLGLFGFDFLDLFVFNFVLCTYVLVLMFKSMIMFLCVLVQNEFDLKLCILFFLILFFLFLFS